MTSLKETDTNNGQKPPRLPFYMDVDGYRMPGFFIPEVVRTAFKYQPRPDDLFIVTYPKCGTTWVQNIVACIYREGRPFQSAIEFMSQTPFLEMAGAEAAVTMKRPGAIKLHTPYHLTPQSTEAKYIFIARNPKDCCVSFYHHTENIPGYLFEGGEFDDYFELFVEGKVDCGDYFDTLLSWYEHRNDSNVLFLTYEQLKENTETYVLKIAEFMGQQYKEALEKDPQMVKDVIHHSSFGFMKENLIKQFEELKDIPKQDILNNPDIPPGLRKLLGSDIDFMNPNGINLIRKGIVGDWKNYFSQDQNEQLMKKYRERTAGTEIPDLWKNYM